MAKKVNTPIYDALKAIVVIALSASKLITGPYGWIASTLTPKLMDILLKPLFIQRIKNKIQEKFKKKSKKATEDFQNAETESDIMDTFNKLP